MVLLLCSSEVFSLCVASPKPGVCPLGESRGLFSTLQFLVTDSKANWLLLSVLPFKEGILFLLLFKNIFLHWCIAS